MTRSATVPRRTMLIAGLSCIFVRYGLNPLHPRPNHAVSDDWSPRALLDAVLPNMPSAQVIGDAYLRAGRIEEASAGRLMSLIFVGKSPPIANAAEIKTYIRRRLQQDFADGAVVKVDGWMLSITEARLCALATVAAG